MSAHVFLFTLTATAHDDRIYYKEARTLRKAGFRVSYLGPFPSEITDDGIELINLPTASNLIKARKEILFHLNRLKPDIVQTYDPLFFRLLLKRKKKTGLKVVYNVSESYPDMYREFSRITRLPGKLYAVWVEQKEKFYSSKWDGIIVTDEALHRRFGNYRKDSVLVHLYPPLDIFNYALPPESDNTDFKLVYVGQLRRERGIFTLTEALKLLPKSISLHFYGQFDYDEEKARFLKICSEPSLKNRIFFHGFVDHLQIPEILQRHHLGMVTLHPLQKFRKNEPTKLFEYMAAGLPVIGSDFAPIKTYIERFNCGLTCQPESPQDIARAVEFIFRNPDRWKEYSLRGRKAVEKELNWESQMENFLSIYKKIVLEID